jgi:hypothetical protein
LWSTVMNAAMLPFFFFFVRSTRPHKTVLLNQSF